MIRLFLENKEVELTEDIEFSINKYFENILKPTEHYVEFSKTVNIPFTQKNNALFGWIYEPDRITTLDTASDPQFTGIHFDPYRKIDMRLQEGDNILLKGYAKMLSIDYDGSFGSYSLNLYGELGKVFSELNKMTFDSSEYEDEDDYNNYYIDGSEYYDEYVNYNLIFNSWNNNHNSMSLLPRTDSKYKNYNVIGWSPLNIKTDAIDQKSFEKDGETKTFQEVLEDLKEPTFVESTNCNAETAIGDGLLPRDIGEFRSYLQQPYIYFNQLLQIVGAKCKSTTGYEFDLDELWFNSLNPYYYDTVLSLKNYEQNDEFVQNGYNISSSLWWHLPVQTWNSVVTDYVVFSNASEAVQLLNSDYESLNLTNIDRISTNTSVKFYLTLYNNRQLVPIYDIDMDDAIIMSVAFEGKDYSDSSKKLIMNVQNIVVYPNDMTSTILENLKKAFPGAQFVKTNGSIWKTQNEIEFTANLKTVGFSFSGDNVKLLVTARSWKNNNPIYGSEFTDMRLSTYPWNGAEEGQSIAVNVYEESTHRSFSKATLNTLWNNAYKPFEFIMQYCKMFRIGIFADYVNKKLKFIPLTTYFKDYTIEDWTDKLDKSESYQIQPITYENKFIKFNYDDFDTDINNKYEKTYGVQYGEKLINTNYVFNNDTEELFEGVKCPMENTDNVLSWTNLYDNKKIEYSFPAEKYIYAKDDEGNLVDNFGTFYLDNGVVDFSTEEKMYLRSVIISDDTYLQLVNNTYTYNQYNNYIKTTKYHQLSICYGSDMISFTTPIKTYCYQSYDYYTGLYDTFWTNYLNERYNTQNKIVNCNLFINNNDYNNFDFNHFITIGNQLYFVNKIKDYNPVKQDSETTECELITIQDINGYTTNGFDTVFSVNPTALNINYYQGSTTFTVTTNRPIILRVEGTNNAKINGTAITNKNYLIRNSGTYTLSGTFPTNLSTFKLIFEGGGNTQIVPVTLVSQENLNLSISSSSIIQGQSTTLNITTGSSWGIKLSSSDVQADLTKIALSAYQGTGSGTVAIVTDRQATVTDYTLTVTTNGKYGPAITKTITFNVEVSPVDITITDVCGNPIDTSAIFNYGTQYWNLKGTELLLHSQLLFNGEVQTTDCIRVNSEIQVTTDGTTTPIKVTQDCIGDEVGWKLRLYDDGGLYDNTIDLTFEEGTLTLNDENGDPITDGYELCGATKSVTMYISSVKDVTMLIDATQFDNAVLTATLYDGNTLTIAIEGTDYQTVTLPAGLCNSDVVLSWDNYNSTDIPIKLTNPFDESEINIIINDGC